ncbi:MAG: efflux RND transporter periplasmic adaptor subunit [Arenicellales bacterium]
MRRLLIILIVAALGTAAGAFWWLKDRATAPAALKLYGNVDLRQAALAFNDSGRIESVRVQEGDRVHKGQVLATLDTGRLQPRVEQAQAQVAAQQAVVTRLHNGSRPEEIAQARANLAAAKADALNAERQYERKQKLAKTSNVSEEDIDAARAAMDVAKAKVGVSENALALVLAGPRPEDIVQAEAELRADQAQLALLDQELSDARLTAPSDGVIRSRLMEPGEMASPQRPVFSLALTDPKWVRAYVSEPDLTRVRPGMKVRVTVDGLPGRSFPGWIGFVSPVAEFTPKAIQTEDLRTSLVYEVRVFVKDPGGELRLGMPATVILPAAKSASGSPTSVGAAGQRSPE